MNIDQLIFVGLLGRVLALDRGTGEIVWCNREMKRGDVTMILDGDRLVVSTEGYLYCLDPLTGRIIWRNPLHGYGCGIAHLVSCRAQSDQVVVRQADEHGYYDSAAPS